MVGDGSVDGGVLGGGGAGGLMCMSLRGFMIYSLDLNFLGHMVIETQHLLTWSFVIFAGR